MIYEKWTSDRVKLLKKYWREDLMSASQIAEKLGNTSRNAVIGKIHRMGISVRKTPPHHKRKSNYIHWRYYD